MPADLVVLDTDVVSTIEKGRLSVEFEAALGGRVTCLTFVTVAELYRWMEIRDVGARRRTRIATLLDLVAVLPYDQETARAWGGLSARAERRGRPRPIHDMWIAACCLVNGLPLMTLNRRDFVDFVEHEGLVLVDG